MKTLDMPILEKSKTYKLRKRVTRTHFTKLIVAMSACLRSAIDLQIQMRDGNSKEASLINLHKLFDRLNLALIWYINIIAERIVQLGSETEVTMLLSRKQPQPQEFSIEMLKGMNHIGATTGALFVFGEEVRNIIAMALEKDDRITVDLFTDISSSVEQWLWFLETHSQTCN